MRRKLQSVALLLVTLLFNGNFAFAQPAQTKEWRFRAQLDGREIGEHTFILNDDGSGRTLRSTAKFSVKFLFITAFSYLHKADERWNGNCLTGLTSETVENSERTAVSGSVSEGVFQIKDKTGIRTLNDCPMTFAYWNPEILTQQKLLNPQTGEWLPVEVKNLGAERITVRGVAREAERYQIKGPKTEIDLWYLTDTGVGEKEWVGLRSITPEGYTVSYELI